MINIISKAYLSKNATGPKKVVDNFIKGLDILGYPYVINKQLDACERLWIHDDVAALARINKLSPEIKIVAGPNLYVVLRQVPRDIDLSKIVYIHPSQWVKDFWLHFGFDRCPIEPWPTGIDTEEFRPSPKIKKFALVYFKQRSQEELFQVEKALKKKGVAYRIINYGNYQEQEYKKLLAETCYVIWLGRQESQGIALEEVLATDTPVLVCDVDRVGHWIASQKEMAVFTEAENNFANTTSAAYFDERCGVKIKNLSEIDEAVNKMENEWQNFQPRQYILENLSLEKQAGDLLAIYDKYFGLTIEQGRRISAGKSGNWRNNKLYFKLYLNLKNSAKHILRR